jgi:hypothetical protein
MEVGHTGPGGKHAISHVVEAIVHVLVHVHTLLLQVAELIVRGLGTRHEAATQAHAQVCYNSYKLFYFVINGYTKIHEPKQQVKF